MAETTKKVYAVLLIEIEIQTETRAFGVDQFHRWRYFVNRASNMTEYGVKVIDWRIPSKGDFTVE